MYAYGINSREVTANRLPWDSNFWANNNLCTPTDSTVYTYRILVALLD